MRGAATAFPHPFPLSRGERGNVHALMRGN